ncbi:MAG: SurA N-terminal domain-containing protein [Hyphomonadaceae bacterium]
MLTGIRKATQGWIAGGLLTLIAAAFVVWGIPHDIFQGGSKTSVAHGKGIDIDAGEYRIAFERAMEDLRQQNPGRPITVQDAAANGVDTMVLQQLVGQKALDALAAKMGFSASDAAVAKAIREDPAFHNQLTGAFDKQTYADLLARNNVSTAQYENDLRGRLQRRQIALSAAAGAHAPKAVAEMLFRFETERRVATVAAVTPAMAGRPPTPTDKDLQDFYQANKARFATPEYRKVTLVVARPQAFEAKVQVSEDELRKLYEFEKPKLGAPEQRTFVQVSAPTQEAAVEAARRMAAGEDPEKVAAAMKLQAIPFAKATKAQVPDPAIADAVFALAAGQTTNAIKGRLSWAAAKVSEVTASATPTFEAAREQLRASKVKDAASEALNDAVQKFEDARAAGKSIADSAAGTGLIVLTHDKVDARGASPEGAPILGLADDPALLRTVFQTAAGEASDFAPTPDGGYVLAQVDQVIPAGVRTFEEVKPMLGLAWQAQRTGDAMRKIAEGIVAQVKGGKKLADAARAARAPVIATSQLIDRQRASRGDAPALGAAIFGAAKGEVVTAPDARGAALLVAQVEDIERQDPAANAGLFAQAQKAADNFILTDMLTALQTAAVKAAKVKTNPKLVAQTIGLPDAEESAESAAPKS